MLRALIKSMFSAGAEAPAASAAEALQAGLALHNQGRFHDAAEAYRRALALDAALPAAAELLGRALASAGEHGPALSALDAALRENPGSVQAHCSRALALLALGDYAAAWPEYEWRWQREDMQTIRAMFSRPWWQGEAIRGRTLLVFAEQGFGDALQFVRFVPLLAQASGARIALDCHAPLKALLSRVSGVAEVLQGDDEIPRYDLCFPLMSVPGALGTTRQTLPRAPYLAASPERAARWREILAAVSSPARGIQVGLAWSSDPGAANASAKSVPLPLLAPLADIAGLSFHSLVPGALAGAAPAGGMRITDHSARLKDFAETAGLVANLDLVISVDTAAAHLAAAMGKPTWLMLRSAPDWRWQSDDWYPAARRFQQAAEGDWQSVVAPLAAALRSR
ncbi:MAG: tetratricopeptide repeat protein [Betaproteobacteria bacterium]